MALVAEVAAIELNSLVEIIFVTKFLSLSTDVLNLKTLLLEFYTYISLLLIPDLIFISHQ